ncbi:MAG: AsmA family protein, partial [Elusimicrobiaceae bacterium]|nr:AsmA family protein [Elusimicrobiaceae bacterium]
MLKKLVKILCIAIFLLAGTAVGGFFALKTFLSPEKIHTLVEQYARENWNRQISFQQLSLNWIGLTLKDFALSEESSFEQGTFIQAKEVVAKIDIKSLLKKQIQINTLFLNGVEVTLVQQKDGRFNFSSFAKEDVPADNARNASSTPERSSDTTLVLKADQLSASDCRFIYRNDISGTQTSLDHLNFSVNQFDLAHPFDLQLDFTTHLTQENQPSIDLPIRLEGSLFLANTDWQKAYLQARSFQASYKTVQLDLQGKVENFTAPIVDVTGTLNGVNNDVLAELLPQLPSFNLPTLSLKLQAKTDLTNSNAEFSKIELQTQNNFLSATGNTSWGKAFSYALAGSIQADLSQLVQMTGGSSFHPAGNVDGSFKSSTQAEHNRFAGTFTLKDVSMLYTPFTFEQVSGTVTLADSGTISAALTGQINQGNFVGNLIYKS